MPITPGSNAKLNRLIGCSSILEVNGADTTLHTKILPKNIIIKDAVANKLYLTDGVHNLAYVLEHCEIMSDDEMTADEVSAITSSILD